MAILIDSSGIDVIISTAVGNHNDYVFGGVAGAGRYGKQDKNRQNMIYVFFHNC
jgi:hypothetical protein